jgi:hypothetical protein
MPSAITVLKVEQKMVDWFQNHTYFKERVSHPRSLRSPKKPRAIGGIDVFQKKYNEDITKEAADVREREGISSKNSINVFTRVLRDMYHNADTDIQATCEEEAKATNDSRNDKPPTSEIFA